MPWPDGWRVPKRIGLLIAMSYLGLMGAAALYFGVAGWIAGEHAHVPLFLLGGVLCLIFAAQGILMRVLVRRRTTGTIRASRVPGTREAALVIPYSAGLFWLMFAQTVIILCGFALPIAGAAVQMALETREVGHAIIALVCVVAVWYLLALIGQFFGKQIARGYVALSPTGLYHRSWAFTSFLPWEHVLEIWPFEGGGPVITVQATAGANGWCRRTSRFWKQPESDFGLDLTVRGMYLSVDPALVYHALQFYLNNPRARSELSGDAAVRRLRRADIPVLSRSL
jgi:hypothetical protein